MIENDFNDCLTFKFFNESINPELAKHKFDLIYGSVNESHEHRYVLKYRRIFYNICGMLNYAEITIQGIPMTETVLVLHAFVKNRDQKLRTKVRCSLNEEERKEALTKFKNEFINPLVSICTVGLNELPNELKIEICKYLNLFSLFNLAHSNRFWYDFIQNDDILWKHLYIRDFGSNVKKDTYSDWKTMYKNEFINRKLNKTKRNRWIHRSLPPLPTLMALPWPNFGHLPIGFDEFYFQRNFGRFHRPMFNPDLNI